MSSALQREVGRLRAKLARLTEEAAANEAILRRSQARELDLLNAETLPVLLERMVGGMAESFSLEAVTLVVCDPEHELRRLLLGAGGGDALPPGVMLVESLQALPLQSGAIGRPWLGPYSARDHGPLFPGAGALGSVALIPLARQGRPMGSLNFGSADPQRFTRAHATDFLAHLGVIGSFALENTVNRARLTMSGITDVLTGWHNRRYLQTRLGEELSRAQREGTTLTCLLLDIDRFKRINDSYGHQAGDAVLAECAHRIEAEIRASDVAARYGGEEFVILLPATGAAEAGRLAERIRRAVGARPVALGEPAGDASSLATTPDVRPSGSESASDSPPGLQSETITVSIGIASLAPRREESDLKSLGEGLLARADVALYRAKAAGRNQVAKG